MRGNFIRFWATHIILRHHCPPLTLLRKRYAATHAD
eukprot:COSAG06_NODE_15758_length_1047_cov_1.069620_1_plen_35_part_10